jgi:phosphonoacetaldehyde hydrolase
MTISSTTPPLRGVIFDWAGTTVDYGCRAPVAVFIEIFRRRGVAISAGQARGPMGMEKQDHIRAIAALPEVAAAWGAANGRPCDEEDVAAMYRQSLPLQIEMVRAHADLIPGAAEVVAALRERGLAIGATTGYSRAIMAELLPAAARQGYAPDVTVCADEVPAGRPAPWMAIQAARELGLYPMAALVKVGDTAPDMAEGRNAGMWAVGLSQTGNELGLTADEAARLDPADLAGRLGAIAQKLRRAGAHEVVSGIDALPDALRRIAERAASDERP